MAPASSVLLAPADGPLATPTILILTDTPSRGERLARDLSVLSPCAVLDILDPDQNDGTAEVAAFRAVLSDVSLVRSATIAALRAQLDRLKARPAPYLFLLHEDTPRTLAQVQALGARQVLRADAPRSELLKAVSGVIGTIAPTLTPAECPPSIAAADVALSRIFEAARGGAVDPGLVATGTKFVAQAVRATGIRDWLEVVWRFDDVTHQHCLLVAGLASGFAQSLGLSEADCQRLTQAALLHDIGKAKIPEAVLNKPGALDPEERRIMQQHPSLGHEMLQGSGFSDEMLAVVRSHHEYLDGSGYPDGLRGAEIADLVRLVSVCDVYGALIERRPYKTPLNAERAYSILEGMSGKLDGDLVRTFRPFAVLATS